MFVIYWRSICVNCEQFCFGWSTDNTPFECYACHDQYDASDTKITINTENEIPSLLNRYNEDADTSYILSPIQRPKSPDSVICI